MGDAQGFADTLSQMGKMTPWRDHLNEAWCEEILRQRLTEFNTVLTTTV